MLGNGQPDFPPGKVLLTCLMEREGFVFFIFLQHYWHPEVKFTRGKMWKKETRRGRNTFLEGVDQGEMKKQVSTRRNPPFCSYLKAPHCLHPNGDWTDWAWGSVAQREESCFTSHPPWTWCMLCLLLNEGIPTWEIPLPMGRMSFPFILFDYSWLKFFIFCLQLCSSITCLGRNIL